ncbi:MAG TPA: NAD-dependent epimerase/dehydratase family protein [Candidatus Choladousia intestinigallinarum]|nr:NAD-dependent epimerase/dehydratase family protein [Candidatus Choladousia intestinigallinarum]
MEKLQLTKDPVLQRDLEEIADSEMIQWERFRGKTILITGATGLIGSQASMALTLAGKKRDLNLKVLALVRNKEKAEKMLGSCLGHGLSFLVGDVTELPKMEERIDFILHGAGVTASKQFVEKPVETILTTLKGTQAMLDLAKSQEAEGMVYLSSMEAYGVVDPEHYIVKERDYGYIDPLEVRSSYSESKRMAEGLCAAYAHEYGLPVKNARLAQTFGAGIPQSENRVFAQFARSILKGEDLVLHTDGSKAHCYCYTSDAVLGLLKILLEGEPGQAYNVSNEETFSTIREMAQMLVDGYPQSGSRLVFDIPEDANLYGYAPPSRMLVNSEKLQALGWKPQVNLAGMYSRLMESMKGWKEFQKGQEE